MNPRIRTRDERLQRYEAAIVPAAVLGGVYGVENLLLAQEQGLALFWAHRLDDLSAFVRQ